MKITHIVSALLCACGIAQAQVAPTIDTQPTDTTACPGTTPSFTVAASGDAPLAFQWYKSPSSLLANQTNSTLYLSNVAVAASGGYFAIVTNASGSATSVVAVLTVQTNVTLAAGTNVANACPGSPVTFVVTASGTAPFTYTWKNGATVLQGPDGNNTYTIASVTPADAGTYTVEVSGSCGSSATNSRTLTVAGNPAITAQPQSQFTPVGNGATFSVTASGAATINYQWQTNGVDVPGATASTFSISNATPALSGTEVRVNVTSCGGATLSSTATLTVTRVSGISFDFDTPGQYTNAPYYLIYNNWINGGFLPSAIQAPSVFETATGGTGPWPGSGALDMPPNQGFENTSILLPVNFDFSLEGKTVYASTMFKVKTPITAGRRATQFGLVTSTNFGINDSNPQGFATVILQPPTANTATWELRTQRRNTGGGLQESVVVPATSLTVSNWYRLNVMFLNTKASGPANSYTITASVQDMGPLGNTPGATNMSFTTTTNNADIVNFRNVFLALRSFEDGGMDFRDDTYVWTTPGNISFVEQPANQTVAQGGRAVIRSYVDGEGPYKYQWQRFDGTSFVDIPGARAWNLILPPAAPADNGAQFRVVVTGPANTITSDPMTLTVTAQALAVVGAGSVDGTTVGIEFNQPVDPATAENPANYSINGNPAVAARIYRSSLGPLGPDGIYVVVTPASDLTGAFTVTVTGVKDLSGGAISGANSAAGTVAGLTGFNVNPAVTGPPGENYSFGPGKFIITGGGSDIFSGGDGFRYVYKMHSGDFDVTWRLPYVDTVRFTQKAGVNARFSLDPYSPSVLAAFNPGPMAEGSSTGFRQYTEGTAKQTWGAGGTSWGSNTRLFLPDVWMRLRRVGNNFIRYRSTDGVNWVMDGQIQPFQNYPPQQDLYLGLAVCSARNLFGASALFENFGNFAGYPGATIAITSQPTNFTVNAGSSFTDGAVATLTGGGVPNSGELAFLWQRSDGAGGWTNLPTAGATNNTIAIGPLFGSDNGAEFRAVLQAPGVLSVTSAVFTATVNDTAVPTISSVNPAIPSYQVSEVSITFSEFVSDSALDIANYSVTNAAGEKVTVLSATFLSGDRRTVVLKVDGQLGTGTSSVGVSGVKDLNNNTIATAVRTYKTFAPAMGPVVIEFYQDIGSAGTVANLTGHALFVHGNPSWISYSNLFGFNVGFAGSTFPGLAYTLGTVAEDQMGVKAYTYFVPPTNGTYKFWIRADDRCQLFINTNGTDPAGKVLIAELTGNNATYNLGTTPASSITNIAMVAGQSYYMEMLMAEGSGGDGFSVMWTAPNVTAAPSATTFIPTANLAYPSSAAPKTPVISEFYVGYTPLTANNGGVANLTASTNLPLSATNFYSNNSIETMPNWKYLASLPDHIGYQKYFGAQPQLQNTRVDNYLGKIYAYFVPPTNGNYKFYIRGDDAVQLYMNTNAVNSTDPAGKKLLGRVDAYTSAYTLAGQNVSLVGGQRYYIEALWREGGGGDGVAVAVRAQGDSGVPPVGPPVETIPASMLEYPLEIGRAGAVDFTGIFPAAPIASEGQSLTMIPQGVMGGPLAGNAFGNDAQRSLYGFLWFKNGVRISENSFTNITPALTMADNGAVYTLVITNAFSRAERSVTLTVVADTTAPTIARTVGWRNGDGFSIEFSEPVDPMTATFLGNYQVSGGLNIVSASVDPLMPHVVAFTTSKQAAGTTYNITVSGVRDLAGTPNTITAGSTTSFSTWTVGGSGFMVEIFKNLPGGTIGELVGSPKYANNLPDVMYYTNVFGIGPFGADSGLNHYGARITGNFVPTNTGYYRFFLRSDDASMLLMNINGPDTTDPAGKQLILHMPNANVSFSDARAISAPIYLTQGQRYYTEALLKEGTGGDYMLMTFRESDVNGNVMGNPLVDTVAELQPASGNFDGAPGNPDLIQVVSTPPTDVTVMELDEVTLSLGLSVPASVRNAGSFQWQKYDASSSTFTNIPGARSATITFIARLADDGIQYRLQGGYPGFTGTWSTMLHVTADTVAPKLVSAATLDGAYIVLTYDKAVSEVTATEPNNYDVDGFPGMPSIGPNPNGIGLLLPDQRTVIFQIDPSAAPTTTFHVNAWGTESQAATPVAGPSEIDGNFLSLIAGNIGLPTGNVAGGYNPFPTASAYVFNGVPQNLGLAISSNAVNVAANGYDIWNAADGFYFAYRQVSGNFDIKTRVQKLDGADQWSKAGIMARTDITNTARMVMMGATPATTPIGTQTPVNAYSFQVRPNEASATGLFSTNSPVAPTYPNAWVRLQRVGNVFTGYYSSNNVDWVQLESRDMGATFPATVYLGLATASHDQTRGLANNAYAEYRDLYFPLAPTITQQPTPADATVALHGSVTFSGVQATGAGTISYQWTKNGVVIPGQTGNSLTLNNLSVSDGGVYNVIAGNDGGGTKSVDLVLTVVNDPPVVVNENIVAMQNTPTNINVADLLANDSDPEGDPLSVLAVSGVAPASYSANFNDGATPTNMTIYPVANIQPAGGVADSQYLQLTAGAGSQSGGAVLAELTPGKRVSAFTASFMLRIADGSAEPADGFSFNFAPDIALAAGTPNAAENGAGTGFSFCVDNYRFAPAPVGAPAVGYTGNANTSGMRINYGGIIIAAVQMPGAWNNVRWIPVSITVTPSGVATVIVDGTNVFGNLMLPNYTPRTGRVGLYARTGGAFASHAVDDLNVTVQTLDTALAYNLPSGNTFGSAYISVDPSNSVNSILRLTDNANGQNGAFVLNELTPAVPVQSFNASFKVRIGNGTADAADGMNFSFAGDLPNGISASPAEEGTGTGLSLCIDNYPAAGPGAPAIKVKLGGTELATQPIPKWNSPNWVPINVSLAANGEVTVVVDGTNVFTALPTSYTPTAGKFGFFARTGGQNETHWVDDVSITANTASGSRTINEVFNASSGPANVTLAGGVITYNPGGATCGNDSFYYLVSDGQIDGGVWGVVNVNLQATNGVQPVIEWCVQNQNLAAGENCQGTLPDLTGQLVASGNCVTVTQNPAPGTLLAMGPHTVTFTVTDSANVSLNCQATVTVVDSTAPVVTCPSNITNAAPTAAGVVVNFTPTATDNCTLSSLVAVPASGSTFPVGTTTVTVTATDAAGNTNACTFDVVVEFTAQPTISFSQSGGTLTLSWPAANGFVLEETTDLTPPATWTPSTETVTTVDGTSSVAITPGTTGNKYFRLRKP